MKSYHITALILAISLWGCGPKDHDEHAAHSHEAHEHADGHEHGSHDHDGHSHAPKETHSHDGEIDLHDEVAERFGVKFDTIRPAGFHEVVRVSGRAEPSAASQGIVSAPVSGTVHFARGINAGSSVKAGSVIAVIYPAATLGGDANAAAKANLDAAKRELDRIKPLYEDRLVTASEYNNALAAY